MHMCIHDIYVNLYKCIYINKYIYIYTIYINIYIYNTYIDI